MMIEASQVKIDLHTMPSLTARRKKSTWGGFREGAGRKAVLRDPCRYTMDFEGPQMEVLQQIASKRGVSVASVVREAVARYVARRGRK
jgi:hypothetical protein